MKGRYAALTDIEKAASRPFYRAATRPSPLIFYSSDITFDSRDDRPENTPEPFNFEHIYDWDFSMGAEISHFCDSHSDHESMDLAGSPTEKITGNESYYDS